MVFFYTGRLSSSTSGGGASFDASLLRGFQQDVVGTPDPCGPGTACIPRCSNIESHCQKIGWACETEGPCIDFFQDMDEQCRCDETAKCVYDLYLDFVAKGGVSSDIMAKKYACVTYNWEIP